MPPISRIDSLWQWGFRDALMDFVLPIDKWPTDAMTQEYRSGYASGRADAEAQANMPAKGASWEDMDREACEQAVKALRCSECLIGLPPDERTEFMGRTVCETCNDFLQREHAACMMEHEHELHMEREADRKQEAKK